MYIIYPNDLEHKCSIGRINQLENPGISFYNTLSLVIFITSIHRSKYIFCKFLWNEFVHFFKKYLNTAVLFKKIH